jgi:hypothetical protein
MSADKKEPQFDMFFHQDGGAKKDTPEEKKSELIQTHYDMFDGVYQPLTIDRLVEEIDNTSSTSATDKKTKDYTNTAYRHRMDGEEWKKEIDHDKSMHLSILSVLYEKLRRQPFCWCQSTQDLERLIDILKQSPYDLQFRTRDGKSTNYIPSTRDTTRSSLQYILNDPVMSQDLNTILEYSKFKYWRDLPMSEFYYIPPTTHRKSLPSIYASIAKTLYLWNTKTREFPTDDLLQNTARSLRHNVMTYVFHNLYTCFMDGIQFHDLLAHEYTLNKGIVEDFYQAIASGSDFTNPCKDVFTDEWIRAHWNEWDNALKYLTYISQDSEIPDKQSGKTIAIHPGNTSDIFFLSQYTNRIIVLCNIQNGLSTVYHPYQVALPITKTAHQTVPLFLYSESDGQYGILWMKHFGKTAGSKETPPQSMVYQTAGGSSKHKEGVYSKRKNAWIIERDPYNIMDALIAKYASDLEYQPPMDLFLYTVVLEKKEEVVESPKIETPWTAPCEREERYQCGSYMYPMNISNLDILKEYIENSDHHAEDMPVDVGCLMKEGCVRWIDMNTSKGQTKYRNYVRQKLIIPIY